MRTYPPKLVKTSVLITLTAALIVTPSLASTASSVPVAPATRVSTLATLHAGAATAKKEHAKTSAALKALNKTIKANKTMTSKTDAQYLSTADQKILKNARTTAVKKRDKALKGCSSTASISKAQRTTVLLKAADKKLKSSTLQATKRYTSAAKSLNSTVTALNTAADKASVKNTEIKNGDNAWKAFVPGLDAGLHYKPNTGWTRESVMIDARNRGATQMYEAEQIDGKGVITHRFEWNKGKWVEVKEFS